MILRCTTKVLFLLGYRPSSLVAAEPCDNWYANLVWIERRKCILLVHADTLFSAVALDVRKADLMPIGPAAVTLIEAELISEGLPANTFGSLDPADVQLAKTASKVVLGYMNEMARFCDYFAEHVGGIDCCDSRELNHALRRELHLPRQAPGYIVPIDQVRQRTGPRAPAAPSIRLVN